MHQEIASNYAYNYDLLRTYLLELLHIGQKLYPAHRAPDRVAALHFSRPSGLTPGEYQLQLRIAYMPSPGICNAEKAVLIA